MNTISVASIQFPQNKIISNKPNALTSCIKKICSVVRKIFRSIADFIFFPIRYFGSKTWSIPGIMIRTPFAVFKKVIGLGGENTLSEELFGKGYQFKARILDKESTKKLIRSATFSTATHNFTPKWKEALDSFGLNVVSPKDLVTAKNQQKFPKNINVNDTRFFDPKSGLKMMVASNDSEVLIAFGALGAPRVEMKNEKERKELEKKIWRDVVNGNLAGFKANIYEEANQLFEAIKDQPQFKGKKLKLVGHCMGGSLATYIGLKHQKQVHAFNTLAFGVGIQEQLGQKRLSEADKYVTHLSIENDFFSNCQKISTIDRLANLIGIKTPGNFGKHYKIPPAKDYTAIKNYSKRQDAIHNFFLGSMMEYIGHSNRTLPQSLKDTGHNMALYSS